MIAMSGVLEMKKLFVGIAVLACWLAGAAVAGAVPQTIRATGVYTMGDNDSPKIARDAARQEAMRSAVEQAGVYVESYSKTQNMELTEDDVRVISGAVLKVTDEKATPELVGSVMKYTVNIRAEVDTDNIDFEAMLQNRKELEKLQQERDELKRQNEELLRKYEQAKGKEKKEIGHRLENQYTLGQIFDECVALIQRGEQRKAISKLTDVVKDSSVTDSPLAYAYYLRGRAYYELRDTNAALVDFTAAEETPHDNSIYPIWKCHQYRGLIYYDRRMYRESYNELQAAWDSSPKNDNELWEALQRAKRKLETPAPAPAPEPEPEQKPRVGNSDPDWGKIIGNILIGAISKEIERGINHAQDNVQRESPPPKVYHGKARRRIPV